MPTTIDFCQPYDVNINANEKKKLLGNDKTSYYMHTTDTVLSEIETSMGLGINKICLRPTSNANVLPQEKLELFSKLIRDIRINLGSDLKIIIDSFAIAIHPDLTWGLRNNAGKIDPYASLKLIGDAAVDFIQAGANEFLTIGRINFEVREVFERLQKENLQARIVSFSTNPETAYAYINTTLHDPRKSNTGQKIIVGNTDEMILRAFLDFLEGTDSLIQKPINSYHIISTIRSLLMGEMQLETFLSRSKVQKLVSQSPSFLLPMVESLKVNFEAIKNSGKQIGAYSISGSYAISRLIEQYYNPALAIALLQEEYLNMKAAADNMFDTIIDRNASWYLTNRAALL